MIVKNITQDEFNESINELNTLYNGNIKLNDYKVLNQKGTRHRFTLRVNNSVGQGSRHGHSTKVNGEFRRTNSVCFHGHGDLFEMFFKQNDKCEIRSRGNLITSENGNWKDFNIGNRLYPMYMSETCEC